MFVFRLVLLPWLFRMEADVLVFRKRLYDGAGCPVVCILVACSS